MNSLHFKYVLAGGGLASTSAARAIRDIDPEGSILLVGQEVFRPYHRPPLSKEFLRGEKRVEELYVMPADWYAEQRVSLRTGQRCAQLDTSRRRVTLETGEEVSFDKLLIATGASAKHLSIPGSELPNIYCLRNLADFDRLHNAAEKARSEGRKTDLGRGQVVVVGGGPLGVELAASFRKMGLTVDLLLGHSHPWEKFAGESTGALISGYLSQRGVSVHASARPTQFEGDGRVQRVALADGAICACDFAVTAVGMNSNKELLRGTPIAAERAILADEYCQTNVEGIYAAGDCAAIFDPLFGKHRVLDHWDNAVVTGSLAGRNMAGAGARYDAVNYFFSDVFDLSLSAWGDARLVDHRLLRGKANVDQPDFIEVGVGADGRIAQVLAVSHAGEDDLLRDLVKRRVNVRGREEAVKDPAFDLAQLH